MRLAIVSQEYPPETAHGGIATQARLKARGLADLGHDVVVVSSADDRAEGSDGPVRVVRISDRDLTPAAGTEAARWLARSLAVATEVHRIHTADPLDLVEFPEWGAEGFVHMVNRPDRSRPAVAVHLHGPLVMLAHTIGWPDPGSGFYGSGTAMEGACLRLADLVYSSSETSARWCAERYGLDRNRIPVLHAGVDTDRFTPQAGPRARDPTIAFVGRVAESKGADTLVRAALEVARELPSVRVELVGRCDEGVEERLRAMTREADRPDLLVFAGHVPAERLPERLARAWVLAAPSRYEGGPGFVVLEAMACEVPVVASSGSGLSESFAHAEHGLTVPPDAPADLARALLRLLSDETLRDSMGSAARRHVEKTADTRGCVRRLETLYLDLIEEIGSR